MHFYKLFEHKCVLAVCTQPLYNDKTFLFDLIKSLQFFKSSHLSVWRHSDRGPSHDSLIDSSSFSTDCTSVLPQTRAELAVISCFTAGADVDKNDFVIGCNNEHSNSHLLPSSERLKRITFSFEWNAPSICLNVSIFTQIIRDPASSTEVSTRFFKWIFANCLS